MNKYFPATTSWSKKRGFSLVEVSIAMSISLLATVAVLSVFITSSKMAVESFMRNKTTMDARLVIDKLTTDVRMAKSLETPDPYTLTLKVPSIDSDGFAIDPATTFDFITYHQKGTSPVRFVRTVVADAASTRISGDENLGDSAAPGVYAVQPDALGDFVVYYQFNSMQKHGDKTIEIPAAGTIQLRNHS